MCGTYNNILEEWSHICAASVSYFTRRYSSASPKGMNGGRGGERNAYTRSISHTFPRFLGQLTFPKWTLGLMFSLDWWIDATLLHLSHTFSPHLCVTNGISMDQEGIVPFLCGTWKCFSSSSTHGYSNLALDFWEFLSFRHCLHTTYMTNEVVMKIEKKKSWSKFDW